MTSRGTGEFWKRYHALPPDLRAAARRAYRKFTSNPAHPSLHLERLTSDARFWSVRVTVVGLDVDWAARRVRPDFSPRVKASHAGPRAGMIRGDSALG